MMVLNAELKFNIRSLYKSLYGRGGRIMNGNE